MLLVGVRFLYVVWKFQSSCYVVVPFWRLLCRTPGNGSNVGSSHQFGEGAMPRTADIYPIPTMLS